MKKILPYIFLFLIFVNLFAPFSVGEENLSIVKNTAEAGNCSIVSAVLTPHTGEGNYIAALAGKQVTLTVKTSNCLNEFLTGQLIEKDAVSDNPVLNLDPLKITAPDGTVTLTFLAGEDHCESGKCEIVYKLGITTTKTTPFGATDIISNNGMYDAFFDSYSVGPTVDRSLDLDFLCANAPCKQGNTWVMNGATGISQTYIFTYDTPVVAKDAITISGTGPQDFNITSNDTVTIGLYDSTMTAIPLSGGDPNPKTYNVLKDLSTDGGKTMKYSRYISGLTPATTYIVTIEPNFTTTDSFDSQFTQSLNKKITLQVTTLDKDGNVVTPPPQGGSNGTLNENQNPGDVLPECSLNPIHFQIMGCVAVVLYYLLFVPTSFLFALTGNFFDWTFHYSVTDTSYRSGFVVQGWGIVRDICNMFFIFVLLYIAFATILGLHGVNAKDMIVNVIIIGILINFSMFAAQVVIDASNILARVFYNSNTIFITKGANGQTSGGTVADGVTNKTAFVGPDGQLELSAALVNKVNPQDLIIHSTQVGIISDKGNATNTNSAPSLSAGTFILITLLATAVNIVGMIVFLSVGLIFVARVIGLWFSMIFAPLAFFTYTVPSMKNIDMIGWEKWWSELVRMSFLAPIFIFFLYLIIKFLDTGFDLIHASGTDGIGFVMSVTIPFVFIMLLLIKAKDLAKDFSGKLGQTITGGVAAVGGLALGGAALGAAFAGRQTIGAVGKYAQNDEARKKVLSFKDTQDAWAKSKKQPWNVLQHISTANTAVKNTRKASMAGIGAGIAQIGKKKEAVFDPATKQQKVDAKGNLVFKNTSAFQRHGQKVQDKAHADHELDEKAQAVTGNKDAKFKDLSETQVAAVKEKVNKDVVAKETHNTTYDKLKKGEKARVDQKMTASGGWTQAAEKSKAAAHAKGEHLHTADDMIAAAKANTAMGEFVTALRKGSYDLRNLSGTKSNSKGFAKFGVGLLSAVAAGTRMGLKQSGINHGVGQKDFFKDLGHTLTEAMKSVKVDIKVGGGGGGGHGGGDDHGGGHGGGGGGHH